MRHFLAALLLAFTLASGSGQTGEPSTATVRITSHGASGVVVSTTRGRTLIVTAAHAFDGPARTALIVLDVPGTAGTGRASGTGTKRLAALDRNADLAVIELLAGPLPGVAPVARVAPRAGEAVTSCGYDAMRWPAVAADARVVLVAGDVLYTDRRPAHGRSGGPLVDAATGDVVGICSGYEERPNGRGVYASWGAIRRVLGSDRDVPDLGGQPAVREQRSGSSRGGSVCPDGRCPIWR